MQHKKENEIGVNKMAVLVKTDFNYADEFNCREFKVMDDDEYERWLAAWERKFDADKSVEIYFGTNEALTISSYDEFLAGLEITELAEVERKVFERHFCGDSWGTGSVFDFDDFDDEYYDDGEDEEVSDDFDVDDGC